VTLQGPVIVGRGNVFHAHVTVGSPGAGRIEIGEGNVFRESTHVDGPKAGAATLIGSRNHFGTWVGIGSGSKIGNGVRVGSLSALGENCVAEDDASIEGQCVIEDNRLIGACSFIRSQVPVSADVPPFMLVDGNPSEFRSLDPAGPAPAAGGAP
jgi:UDP-N-acetylglucosamine acyltransferase